MMVKVTAENRLNIPEDARVRLDPAYGHGAKYFVCYLDRAFCLIADCKRDCKDGMGHIYSLSAVDAYQTA